MKRFRLETTMEQALLLAYRMPQAERRYGWAVWPDQEPDFRRHLQAIGYTGPVTEITCKQDAQGREVWVPVEVASA